MFKTEDGSIFFMFLYGLTHKRWVQSKVQCYCFVQKCVPFSLTTVLAVFITMSAWLDISIAQSQLRGVTVERNNSIQAIKAQSGKAWAVVVGIDDYQNAPHLSYAVADAQSMEEMLTKQGFSVVSFYNKRATRQAILSELGDRLPTMVGESDRVVVFFAGHGETRQYGSASMMGYLLPVESRQTALSATAIDMGVIRTLAQALPAKQVLFLIDVCYGGIAGQRFRSLSPMTNQYLRVITREKGRQLIAAGGADQQAVESPEWGHSAFTYFLLKGLGNGLADMNGDGIIPASELYTYLDQRVYSAAQLIGHTQRPELWRLSAEQGEFVFFPDAPMRNMPSIPNTEPEQLSSETNGETPEVVSLRKELEVLQNQVHALLHSKSPTLSSPTVPKKKKAPEPESVKSFAKSRSPLELCEQGVGDKCFQLARRSVIGGKTAQKFLEGARLFEKGCRAGHLNSCTALGHMLWLGNGVKRDKDLAFDLWSFACKKGNSKACSLIKEHKGAFG